MASTGTHATPPLIRTPTSVALTGLLSGGAVRILVKDKSDSGSVHVAPQRKNHYMAGTEASLQRVREMEAALAAEKDKENSFNASPSKKAPKDVSTAVVSTPKRPTTHVAVFTPPSSARKASGAKVAARALLSPGAATPTRAKAAGTNKAVGMKTPPRSVAKGAAVAAAATATVTPRRTAAAVSATHRAAAAGLVTPRAQPPAAGSARIPAARSKSAPRAVPAPSAAGAGASATPKPSAVVHKRPTQGVTTSPRPITVPTPATAPPTAVKKTVAPGTTKAATPGPRPSPSPRATSLLPARTPGAVAKAGARGTGAGSGRHGPRSRPQSAPRGSSNSSLLRHHHGSNGNGVSRGGGKTALVSISVIQVTCPAPCGSLVTSQ